MECSNDVFRLNQEIPLGLTINNKRCKEPITNITLKLIRNVKFRIDLGSGQEVIDKTTVDMVQPDEKIAGHSKG